MSDKSETLLVELVHQVAQLREDVGELKATARWWGLGSGLFAGFGGTLVAKLLKWTG